MPKRGCLGFSLPILAGILLVFFLLFVVGFIVGPLGRSMFGDQQYYRCLAYHNFPGWLFLCDYSPNESGAGQVAGYL